MCCYKELMNDTEIKKFAMRMPSEVLSTKLINTLEQHPSKDIILPINRLQLRRVRKCATVLKETCSVAELLSFLGL